MGSGGGKGLKPPSQPTGGEFKLGSYKQTQDFSAPVSFGGDKYGVTGGGNQLSATNKTTGKSVSSKDYRPAKDYSALAEALSSLKPSQSESEMYKDYSFSPETSAGLGNASPMMNSGNWIYQQDKGTQDSIEQFLQWQRKMGY